MIEVGTKINSWTYIGPPQNGKRNYGSFKCDCGTVKDVSIYSVIKEKSKSCKCCTWNRYGLSKEDYRTILAARSHALQRCYNPKNPSYLRYGPRGITVCTEWAEDVDAFVRWAIANGWKRGLSLDRIDNDGNYEPGNCRWATAKEQARNKSTCVYLTHNGVTKTLIEWCEEYGVPHYLPLNRLHRGCTNFNDLFAKVDMQTGGDLYYRL